LWGRRSPVDFPLCNPIQRYRLVRNRLRTEAGLFAREKSNGNDEKVLRLLPRNRSLARRLPKARHLPQQPNSRDLLDNPKIWLLFKHHERFSEGLFSAISVRRRGLLCFMKEGPEIECFSVSAFQVKLSRRSEPLRRSLPCGDQQQKVPLGSSCDSAGSVFQSSCITQLLARSSHQGKKLGGYCSIRRRANNWAFSDSVLFLRREIGAGGGFEPPRLAAPPPQDGVSANSTTPAYSNLFLGRLRWRPRRLSRGNRFGMDLRLRNAGTGAGEAGCVSAGVSWPSTDPPPPPPRIRFDRIASETEVSMKRTISTTVAWKEKVAVPRGPKAVWLPMPPNTPATSAPVRSATEH